MRITGENKISGYITQSVNADMFVDFTVEELFFEDLPINIPMTVSKNDTIQSIIPKLAETLDSFSDDLVVLENNTPVGFIGGYEVLKTIFENPTFEFIKNTSIEQYFNKNLTIVDGNTSLEALIEKYKVNQRAFSVIIDQSKREDFLVLSAKNALNAGTKLESTATLNEIEKKQIIEFSGEESIKIIINRMFENKVRRLRLKNSKEFISDRTILTDILRRDYLENDADYLSMASSNIKTIPVEDIPKDTKISTVCKIIHNTSCPCITSENNVITPWDILNHLLKL